MKNARYYCALAMLALTLLVGCAEPKEVAVLATVEVPVTVVIPAATLEPLPTYTPYPTYTLYPTYTVIPTETQTRTPQATATMPPSPMPDLTAEELAERLAEQPLSVVSTKYIVQSASHKILYPDMLSAVVRNNGEDTIRDLVLAFAAWDANGLPILLKGHIDFSDGAYVRKVKATGVNLVPGAEWGEGKGYAIAEGLNVDSFAAVAVSYTSFDDEEWENEYFDEWLALYEGKPRERP
ncbi:MAG: hypothetical protein H5T66_00245 [Chloroflexi bacterium]|nr:hypothetical protein [Chloroflexota bacterium]